METKWGKKKQKRTILDGRLGRVNCVNDLFSYTCRLPFAIFPLRLPADDSHSGTWGEHKYCGPRSSRGKVWAGVAGRPPLMVEVRARCFVFFFSSVAVLSQMPLKARRTLFESCRRFGEFLCDFVFWRVHGWFIVPMLYEFSVV